MKNRRIWKIGLSVLLLFFGVLLYADILSIHQIYPIPDAIINHASSEQTRQELLADRDRRDREEQTHKIVVGLLLGTDAAVLLLVGASFFRRQPSSP
jgi:hypothetical protein